MDPHDQRGHEARPEEGCGSPGDHVEAGRIRDAQVPVCCLGEQACEALERCWEEVRLVSHGRSAGDCYHDGPKIAPSDAAAVATAVAWFAAVPDAARHGPLREVVHAQSAHPERTAGQLQAVTGHDHALDLDQLLFPGYLEMKEGSSGCAHRAHVSLERFCQVG